ncbi:MAG: hypothetical protein COT89_03240 [Candidatus Colwellbacteria bacterium CG10_big_fil_rev_8_21_14_0_10_42_22]|uniref:Uncharacterized protein n=1 Tax=Candidatus Colwellbacteria bacterium CG10_big_fil_rev_8_21_14_0_10_42_22 TaxID=1974540 RepID=A0A2H0VFC4_9BACT|nr:MAG: hypothetical protein COT89_03240 [Candidatus Colwellbacteria bacterium CG10_big_fil_rev_8_21_14_0_10_42_22]
MGGNLCESGAKPSPTLTGTSMEPPTDPPQTSDKVRSEPVPDSSYNVADGTSHPAEEPPDDAPPRRVVLLVPSEHDGESEPHDPEYQQRAQNRAQRTDHFTSFQCTNGIIPQNIGVVNIEP